MITDHMEAQMRDVIGIGLTEIEDAKISGRKPSELLLGTKVPLIIFRYGERYLIQRRAGEEAEALWYEGIRAGSVGDDTLYASFVFPIHRTTIGTTSFKIQHTREGAYFIDLTEDTSSRFEMCPSRAECNADGTQGYQEDYDRRFRLIGGIAA